MELEVIVHHDSESEAYWAEVVQLPGCFAAGKSREELMEALEEAIHLYLSNEDAKALLSSDHVEGVEKYRFSDDHKLIPA